MKPAREPASIRHKALCILEKKPHESCPFAAPCGPRRKKNDRGQRSAFPSETSRFALSILAHGGSALPWLHRWALWYLWNPWIMPVRGTPCTGTCNRPVGILWVIEPCAYPVRVSVFSQGSCRAILCLGVLPHACTLSKCAPLDYTQVCVALDFLCR